MLALPKQEPAVFAKPKGDERNRIIRMRTALIMGSPFYGLLAGRLKLVEKAEVGTAATDGKQLFYNPAYVAGMSDAKLRGLIGHETLHCCHGHIWRRGTREHRLWNIACDYAIDQVLVRGGFDVPNPLVNPAWQGWSAEQIYAVLLEEVEEQRKGSGKPTEHGSSYQQALDALFGEGPSKGEVLDAPAETAIQDQASWNQAISAAAQVAKAQGKLPADLEILIEEAIAPRVDWKALTARFAQQAASLDYTWRSPSSRYAPLGLYLPRLKSERIGSIVFGWDTSGSHYDKHTQESTAAEVTEIIRAVEPEKLYVGYCDAALQGTLELEPGDTPKWKPKGGGGTDFRPVFEWVEKESIEPACLIFMTDCMGTFPDEAPPYPVLWLSTIEPSQLNERYTPPFGEVVFLDLK